MGILKQISEYLFLSKKSEKDPKGSWIKYMHGVNRLSILLFLVAMVILAIKLLRN